MITSIYNVGCCPLCGGDTSFFHEDAVRDYHRCNICKLVFVPKQFHVTLEREKKEYDLHQNSCEDAGYLGFLSRFSDPFVARLGSPKCGLDFGCGPGPALATLIEHDGHSVALYDPLYKNDETVLSQKYDFITATEVVEHFRDPSKEFIKMFQMLVPAGFLGIMTKMVKGEAAFKTWHYIRDLTHVAFYNRSTFEYIARQFDADVEFVADDVIFFQKHS